MVELDSRHYIPGYRNSGLDMIATMIPSSDLRPSLASTTTVVVTFVGQDAFSQIKAVNASGIEVASFTVDHECKSFTIIRTLGLNTAPVTICSGHKSSLSGVTTMTVHGQEIKYKSVSDSLALISYVLDTPMGRFKWHTVSTGKRMELMDSEKRVVAEADLKEAKLSVLVSGDEMFLHCLLAGWVALGKAKKATAKGSETADVINGVAEVIGALGGGGGGGDA